MVDKIFARSKAPLAFVFVTLAALGGGCKERDTGTAGAEVRGTKPGAETQQPAPLGGATAEPIRDIDILIITADRRTLLNRQVDVVGAEVQKVGTDRIFWIGQSAERSVPVYLDDAARAALLQTQHKLQKGDKVALVGDLRETPPLQRMEQGWSLSAADAEAFARSPVYLHARRILVGAEGTPPGQPGVQPGQPGTQPGQQGAQPGQPGAAPQPGQKGAPPAGQQGRERPR
jgi:hypothetical protein